MLSSYYSLLLKLFSEAQNQSQIKKLHCLIVKTVLPADTFLSNNLITAYWKSGNLVYARHSFDQIPNTNSFSWNAILSAYSKSRKVQEMEKIFTAMPDKDGVSWNSLISGYASCGYQEERAVEVYKLMLRKGDVRPNRITVSTMLILSSAKSWVELGVQVHCQIVQLGFESYVFVGSPLVDMYSKAGLICEAKLVFDRMELKNVVMYNTMITGLLRCGMVEESRRLFRILPERDAISWTTQITGLAQNGLNEEAINLFKEMRLEDIEIDQYTFGSVLTACGSLSALKQGKQIHAYIIRTFYEDNIFVGSALLDMYSKCKYIANAENVFKRMRSKNVVSWTAMLVGYGQNGLFEEAVKVFREMQRIGIKPDDFTLGSVVSSCGNLAILEEGTQFHCQALKSGLISFVTVSNALITLYGKCGSIKDANRIFDEIGTKDEVSWTALISGYSQFGKAKETIDLFEEMSLDGLKPDGVTFIAVISACSRAGLVERGYNYFKSMIQDHGIVPFVDHYTCMIDLFGRAGRLEEAKKFINEMPFSPDAIGWATIMSASRVHGNIEIGIWAAEALQDLEPLNPASFVLLTNLYAAKGRWDDVAQLRRGMRDRGVRKEPGCSWIKYKNKVHIFSADDRSSPYSEQIYAELEELNFKLMDVGYKPELSSVLHDVTEEKKIQMLSHHSEKLAIAFGLIFIPHPLPIRINKNLRVCVDCHNATKYISKIVEREILVRDSVRFHLFKDGRCSCGDFWYELASVTSGVNAEPNEKKLMVTFIESNYYGVRACNPATRIFRHPSQHQESGHRQVKVVKLLFLPSLRIRMPINPKLLSYYPFLALGFDRSSNRYKIVHMAYVPSNSGMFDTGLNLKQSLDI